MCAFSSVGGDRSGSAAAGTGRRIPLEIKIFFVGGGGSVGRKKGAGD